MSIDFYIDDFVLVPYVFSIDLPEADWYYGFRYGRVLRFLWLAIEVIW